MVLNLITNEIGRSSKEEKGGSDQEKKRAFNRDTANQLKDNRLVGDHARTNAKSTSKGEYASGVQGQRVSKNKVESRQQKQIGRDLSQRQRQSRRKVAKSQKSVKSKFNQFVNVAEQGKSRKALDVAWKFLVGGSVTILVSLASFCYILWHALQSKKGNPKYCQLKIWEKVAVGLISVLFFSVLMICLFFVVFLMYVVTNPWDTVKNFGWGSLKFFWELFDNL